MEGTDGAIGAAQPRSTPRSARCSLVAVLGRSTRSCAPLSGPLEKLQSRLTHALQILPASCVRAAIVGGS
jgi:hypothetical protein